MHGQPVAAQLAAGDEPVRVQGLPCQHRADGGLRRAAGAAFGICMRPRRLRQLAAATVRPLMHACIIPLCATRPEVGQCPEDNDAQMHRVLMLEMNPAGCLCDPKCIEASPNDIMLGLRLARW